MNTRISSLTQLSASQLVVIDMQEKLGLAMQPEAFELVTHNIQRLLQAAQLLALPVIITEQYAKGLGNTLAALQPFCAQAATIDKMTFSACATPKFNQQLHRDLPQVILTGMETHICVLQTALDLLAHHKQVFVVEDAVISREPANKANALARLRDAGCLITNTESVLFECLGSAEHAQFKAIAKLIK
ncbi:MAG TPA: isochorismatase family protein [Methylophilus sp.]